MTTFPRLRLRGALAAAVFAGAALAGCAAGDATLDALDPDSAPRHPTYADDVQPIVDDYCLDCHDGTAPATSTSSRGEHGEPRYGDCPSLRAGWSGFERTALKDRTMPPPTAWMLGSRDRLILERWWADGGTCD